MQEVAEGIHRLGAKLVNWYIIVDGGKLTIVDAGNPNQYDQLPKALVELGKTPEDIEAIVLTHGHRDHVGSSARIKEETGVPVHVHHDDVRLVTGEQKREFERHWTRDLYRVQAWKAAAFFVRGGVLSVTPVLEPSEFTDGETIEVPGKLHLGNGKTGARVMPGAFNKNSAQALESLDHLHGIEAATVLPGNGDPWVGGLASAIVQAQKAGPS
jgi:glyoxylase-like metal-dependent hydrolase (beta-lactamase superfamily II)